MNNNSEKFSLTEIIEQYFNNNTPLPSFFSSIDVHEVTEKNITIQVKDRPYPLKVKQSLAENIMEHLPLKAYQDIFSLDWFFGDMREHKAIYAAIKNKRLDLLEYSLEKAEEKLTDNKKQKKLDPKFEDNSSSIISYILTPLRKSLENYYFEEMGYSKNELRQFYKMWQKALHLNEEYEPFRYYSRDNAQSTNIFQSYAKTLGYNEKIDSLFTRLSSNAIFIDIFKDFFNFLSHDEKRELCLQADSGIAENALYHGNKKLIEILEKEQLILPQNYLNVLENQFSLSSSKKSGIDTWLYKKADTILSPQDKLKIEGSTLLSMLIAFKDKEIIINDIFDKYPQLETKNLLEYAHTSLAELNFINSLVQAVDGDKQFFTEIDREEKKVFDLLPALNERFKFKQSFDNIETLEHHHFYSALCSSAQKTNNNLKVKEVKAFILEKFMDLKLAPKNILPKIKI